jgi:asparagine N-glycosylation enzyme membrane subunit Stt3
MAFGNVVLGSSISAIVGIIALLVYTAVYSALNTAALDPAVISMLAVIPTILASVIVVSIVVLGFALVLGR